MGRAVGDGGLPGAVAFGRGMWPFPTHSIAKRELRKELFLSPSPPAFGEDIVQAPFSVDHKGQPPGAGWRRLESVLKISSLTPVAFLGLNFHLWPCELKI